MTAREYLEQLQLQQFGDHPPVSYDSFVQAEYLQTIQAADPEYRRLMEENLRKRKAFEARYLDQLPTPWQSLPDYIRLLQAKDGIDATLKSVGEYKPIGNLVMGSIETERLNALSMFWPDSAEHLIIFNRGLLMALLAASNFVICALSSSPAPASPGPANTEPIEVVNLGVVADLAPRFREILAHVSEGRSPSLKIIVPLLKWQEKEIRWTKLEDAATEFAFAHEYVHILRGHTSPFRDDFVLDVHGTWGDEYEADSLGLDLLVQTWVARIEESNPLVVAFTLQGVCLFMHLVCCIERYSAEVLGSSSMLVADTSSHPFTYLRWLRMIDKARTRIRKDWWKSAIVPQLLTIEQCIASYYEAAVGTVQASTPAAIEWRLQRSILEMLARLRLVPPHLFIGLRYAREVLRRGEAPTIQEIAQQADRELESLGARPLKNYGAPLPQIAVEIASLVSVNAQILGVETLIAIVDRLAGAFLLDSRTRYPLMPVDN